MNRRTSSKPAGPHPPFRTMAVLLAVTAFWAAAAAQIAKDGDPVTIGTWRTLHSRVLGEEREILVHLPAGYEQSTARYPVLFHLYGQQVTNYFADAVGTTERLAGAAEMPPMIVVGVANTDRYRDNLPLQADGTSPGGADAFLRFFAEELIPFVDTHYRTKPYRLLAGPQAGGAFGLYALMSRPGLFHASILRIENPFPGEPAFRQFFLDKASAFVKATPRLNAFVRLHVESSAQPPTIEFAKKLATIIEGSPPAGLRFELKVDDPSGDFVPLVGLAPALRSLFAGYQLPADPHHETVDAIEEYYRAFSTRLGAPFEPPELSLTFVVDRLMDSRRLDEALALVTYELRIHPDSLNALWRLGEINRRMGRFGDARDAYNRFLHIRPQDAALVQRRLAEVEKAVLQPRLVLQSRVDEKSGVRVSEGTFAVFEDRKAASGRLIHLRVVILHARSATPRADPVFVFAGGPGADATESWRGHLESWMLADRDIVLASQRGTGGDNRLGCPRAVDDGNVQGYLDPLFREDVFRPCLATLGKQFDLTKYSTPLAADDYDELRRALGYERINITGGSYGTRMALVYMRQHPQSVRTAVLNGVAPIASKNPLYHAAGFDLVLRGLFAECAGDAQCQAAIPRLDDEFRAILARLEAKPAPATVAHPVTGRKVAVRLTREGFLEALRVMMYSGARNRRVPFLIHRAFEGDFDPFAQLGLTSERNLRLVLALGHLLCVTCAEDVARITEDEILKVAAPTLAGDRRVREQMGMCAFWPKSEIAPDFGEPVHVDVPTLLLSGTLDPVTPPLWGDDAASHLPRSLHVVVPGAHGVGGPCVTGIRQRFLAAGSAEGLDISCAKAEKPAPFQFTVGR